ncbi:MAG: hypothetical protein EOP11_01600 [Proteobacteria bacterium]|nr:MAG: hypothetical protein EOP11_01600 [Pseudomonadota bacterium]
MKFALLALALAASPALASPAAPKMYDLELKVERAGKAIPVPRLSVIEGETASFSDTNENGGSFVDVVAKEHTKGQLGDRGSVLVSVTVGDIDAKGKRTIYGSPQIVALENETATITQGDSARLKKGAKPIAQNELSVSVTARSEN